MPDAPTSDDLQERIEYLETLVELHQAQRAVLEQDVVRLTMLARSQQRVVEAATKAPDPS